ncbi:MAG TPA: ornithine cyclodeaminase family protein [Verrucomicrobiae bacterium]|jgi:alanine dehydrogenase|nr:ornithine cyclodeaminase family protein [Verrucomicrobiae bacterium]
MLLLKDDDVQKVLTMPMTLDALDATQHELAKGEAATMGRIDVYLPCERPESYYRWAVMTGGARRDGYVVARMLSDIVSWPGDRGDQRENKHCIQPGTYCGLLFMFSARDGMPVALINDGFLQHMRVAGGAGLGVKYLANKQSRSVGMIGSGGMARTYLEAFSAVRKIDNVKVYSPNQANARQYAKEMSEKFNIAVEPAASARDAVKGVDIVSCCTSSIDPVFKTAWLEPGMHVTDVTWDETEPGFANKVDVPVKMGESTPHLENPPPGAFYAAHGFLGYVAGQENEKAIVPRRPPRNEILNMATLADVISGRAKGRTDDRQTTWFLNLGVMGVQFAAVCTAVFHEAKKKNIGRDIPTEWFTQNIRD